MIRQEDDEVFYPPPVGRQIPFNQGRGDLGKGSLSAEAALKTRMTRKPLDPPFCLFTRLGPDLPDHRAEDPRTAFTASHLSAKLLSVTCSSQGPGSD